MRAPRRAWPVRMAVLCLALLLATARDALASTAVAQSKALGAARAELEQRGGEDDTLQSVVSNFVSGLILLVERPFGVGDVVTVGDLTGVVTDVGIRSMRMRTWNGADIAVPNSNLTSATVTNWSLVGHQRGNEINVGVAYGSDPRVVTTLLESAAREQPTVLTDPPPAAFFSGFGDSSLDFTLRYWTKLTDFLTARSALHTTIYQRLGEAGIEIPFPQQDVRLTVEQALEPTHLNAASARAQTSLPESPDGVAAS